MEKDNTKQLQIIAKMLNPDRFITADDIAAIRDAVFTLLSNFKKGNEELNAETKKEVEDILKVVEIRQKELYEDIKDGKKEMIALHKEQCDEIAYLVEEIKAMEPKQGEKGEDADEEKIVARIYAMIQENKSESEDDESEDDEITGEDVIDMINDLDYTNDNLIDIKRIKGWETFFNNKKSSNAKGFQPTVLTNAMDLDTSARANGYAIVWDSATGMHKYAASSGGSMAIGGSVTSATAGSVFFAGASGVLAENNTNFFWDNATNRLGIGTLTLTTGKKLTVAEGTMTANQVGGIQITGDIGSGVGSNGLAMALNNSTSNATGFLRLDRTAASTFIGMTLSATSRDGIRIMTHSSSPVEVARFASTFVKSSGTDTALMITPNINQTSTAGYIAFQVNVTETGTGSGSKLLANFQVGGVTQLSITNAGAITALNATLRSTSGSAYVEGSSSSVYLRPSGQNQNNALRIYAGTNGTKLDLYSSAAANSGVENIYYNGVGILQSDADFRLTTAGKNPASIVTVGGTQTLTGKKATLAAGTATAGTAPLKFTSGVNLTTAEAGAMEYDGTWAYFTLSGTTRRTFVFADTIQTITNKTLTNPTINGMVLNGDVQTDGIPNTDDTWSGKSTNSFNASGTIAQFDCVYLTSSSTWALTDADAIGTAGNVLIMMAGASGTVSNPLRVIEPGSWVRNDAWNWTVGGVLYLDTAVAGGLTQTAPSGEDDAVKIVGYAATADVIYFNPSVNWIIAKA
jgi:hypothetical protein